jgi:hypothetical protein
MPKDTPNVDNAARWTVKDTQPCKPQPSDGVDDLSHHKATINCSMPKETLLLDDLSHDKATINLTASSDQAPCPRIDLAACDGLWQNMYKRALMGVPHAGFRMAGKS